MAVSRQHLANQWEANSRTFYGDAAKGHIKLMEIH